MTLMECAKEPVFPHIRFMKRRMFFKIGVTLIIFVGIILFFIVDVEEDNKSYYQRVQVKDGEVHFIEMSLTDLEDSPGNAAKRDEPDNGVFPVEDIDALIDKEQRELLALSRKPHEKDQGGASGVRNSGSEKQEFYYDNSIPDPDKLNKKTMFHSRDQKPVVSRDFRGPDSFKASIHLCVVVCENRASEALTMLKSAAIVTTDVGLVFHIVADKDRQSVIQKELNSWPPHLQRQVSYHVYDVAFPQGPVTLTAWNKLYKPCASQRLFLPDRLTSLDSVIYVDTDTVFLQSVGALWDFFGKFNSSQLVGLVSESEDGTAGWYNRFASHPYYGHYGVNSGVMLMNMTRIRGGTDWLSVLQEDYEKYRLAMTWGDQDLINIYLAKRPEQAYLIPCNWNYRSDHCMYTSNCRAAEKNGVALVHASRGAFYSDKEPVFGAVHQAFKHVVLGPDQIGSLILDLQKRFKYASNALSSCNYVSSLFLTQLSGLALSQLKYRPGVGRKHPHIQQQKAAHNRISPNLSQNSQLKQNVMFAVENMSMKQKWSNGKAETGINAVRGKSLSNAKSNIEK